jgi:hypothetical protein
VNGQAFDAAWQVVGPKSFAALGTKCRTCKRYQGEGAVEEEGGVILREQFFFFNSG